ncbi:MAG TPA: ABC transporter ATP-binding protein [Ghiorsea sp.]|nr:ABC transporter ATP-binding protein [Ghiorsea sp.]HIP07763.1 ABC transporter ATP-binding protein [Mariprofundaceae bacterium]
MLCVTNLCKSYTTPQGNLEILKSVNLEVDKASFIAIVGESGSGKSTLLQLLGTLDYADSGEIFLNDIAIHNLPENKLATLRNQHIGFIYQAHHLIPELTALENVMLPLLIQGKSKKYAQEKALTLLQQLKLEKRATHIPAHLSGGEAQRVAVARAIITKPTLILADEPTGNLDESTATTVFDMILQLCKSEGVAVIMVTHSQAFAESCDHVYKLSQHQLSKQVS